MTPLYRDPHFLFRFDEPRIVPRFHLADIETGRRVSVFRIDAQTHVRLNLLTIATVGDDGWVELPEPIVVGAGEAFIAAPDDPPLER